MSIISWLSAMTTYLFDFYDLVIDIIWFAYTTKKRKYDSEAYKRNCAAVCDFEMMPELICQN